MKIRQYCKKLMNSNTFIKIFKKYLNELVLLFLREELRQFHFRQPGAHYEARFLADCNYLLVIYMNQDILKHYDNMQSLIT